MPGPALGGARGGERRLDTASLLGGRGRVDRRLVAAAARSTVTSRTPI
ncbi:hypothetical protein OG585_49805 (plasmid) [Streptomyces sp. NBC_01340]|nr:hypothetical protein OG585_49805 [Streptomyces sp. NBC_01340]